MTALEGESELRCAQCGARFELRPPEAIDLRLPTPMTVLQEVPLGRPVPDPPESALAPLVGNHSAQVDFSGLQVPSHLSAEILSYFPAARPGALALDLGCGKASHRAVLERAGFTYLGLDYRNEAADIRGDAHALPFLSQTFELVLSVAVFEHLRLPLRAASEVRRVLVDGGLFLGTVAFLEPMHGQSHFHHTHLGIWATLADAGLEVQWVRPNASWTVLEAQASNALFPGAPRILRRAAIFPAAALHRLVWWIQGKRHRLLTNSYRLRRTTGSFAFLARRPEAD